MASNGAKTKQLAGKFGVCSGQIRYIVKGKSEMAALQLLTLLVLYLLLYYGKCAAAVCAGRASIPTDFEGFTAIIRHSSLILVSILSVLTIFSYSLELESQTILSIVHESQ